MLGLIPLTRPRATRFSLGMVPLAGLQPGAARR